MYLFETKRFWKRHWAKFEQFLVTPRWEKSDQWEKWETDSPRKSDHSSLDATTTKEGQIPWSQVQLNWNNGSKLIYSKWNMKFECEQKDPITSIQVTKEYCNYLNFNCRVSSWPILIHFQYSTNIQRPVQLFQPKRASSKQTPTISNKADSFQAKFNFSEDNVHRFWPIEFFSTEKSKIWSKCDYFIWNP